MVGTPSKAIILWELLQLITKCTCTCGQGRRMGTTAQPSSFPLTKAGETFPVDQCWQQVSECYSQLSLTSLSLWCKPGLLVWLSLPQLCVSGPKVFKQPWPGIMRTLYGKHQQFETIYFKKFPGYYVTGDGKGVQVALVTGTWGQQWKSCPVLPSESLISYSKGWHCCLTLISGYF